VTRPPIAALPRLHAVTDDRVIAGGDVAARARALAAAAGPDLAVHVRSRALSGRAFLALAMEVRAAIAEHGAWLVVNGRADIARLAGARAIISGTGAMTTADVRRVAPELPVGRSVHDETEARAAAAAGADFLVAGAVHETASHPSRTPGGELLLRTVAALDLPVVAIGGITPERARAARAAGAYGIAAIRALWDAPDPGAAAAAFVAALGSSVTVQVNGEPRRVASGSLAELLAELGLDPRAVVVEHNRRIVRRDSLAATPLGAGDSIELVHFVGGG
jgi:thiamine-phosphate pyrophosphorylase